MAAAVDAALVRDWLTARSLARGLPAPVADHGGYRVDTNSDTEIRRWVFPRVSAGLGELARGISQPGYFIKLCGTADELCAALPRAGWQIQASGYVMTGPGRADVPACPPGYEVEVERSGAVTYVKIVTAAGELAASGYGAETADAFVFDRIATAPEHRRRGLGTAVMNTLRSAKTRAATPELLVATEAGRALYQTLGWQILSPYSTGVIGAASI